MYRCEKCGKKFENFKSFGGHKSGHARLGKIRSLKSRLVKRPHRCKFCNKEFENGLQLGSHTIWCELNPNRNQTREKISAKLRGTKLSQEAKINVSKGMKLAHAEGRAWNIGKSRWNNEPSYPEKFFKRVIENEISDKNYIQEYPCGIYSIDFAWPEKKLAFEVDGEQHQRFEEYKERDIRKDKFLRENGWKILRLNWKEVCNQPKEEIKKLKLFLNE